MKEHKNNTEETVYFAAYSDDKEMVHVGELAKDLQVSTGQPNLDIYNTKEECIEIWGEVATEALNNEEAEEITN